MQDKIKEFIRFLKEKKDLAKQVKENQEEINWREPEIRNHFADQGISKLTQDGLTLFIKAQIFAEKCSFEDMPVSNEDCIEALKLAGLDNYCEEKVKTQSLSAYFKELNEEGLQLPKELEGKFQMREVFKISSRKAK